MVGAGRTGSASTQCFKLLMCTDVSIGSVSDADHAYNKSNNNITSFYGSSCAAYNNSIHPLKHACYDYYCRFDLACTHTAANESIRCAIRNPRLPLNPLPFESGWVRCVTVAVADTLRGPWGLFRWDWVDTCERVLWLGILYFGVNVGAGEGPERAGRVTPSNLKP
eukprot:1189465-Prorocentrum_minimum.AAC.2